MRVSWLFLAAIPLVGQTLHVSSVKGTAGERVSMEISLNSITAHTAVAMQWEIIFPVQVLEVESGGPQAGAAAKESGKTLTCVARKEYSYNCVLAGGQKPIGNGVIAFLQFSIRTGARAGSSVFRVEKAESVTVDLKKSALSPVEGTVTIH
jgi:hypothetical protein